MFAGMDFCPHCGAKAARTVGDAASALPCPGCKAEMRAVTIGTTPMHECAACASLWLDAATFTQLCTNREERGAVIAFADVTTRAPTARSAPSAAVRYVPCPMCAKIMNRQNFGRRSGVIVDVCKGHGVWFEDNELHAALAFIDSGGFERARQEDVKQQLDEQAKLIREFEESGQRFRELDAAMTHRTKPGASSLLEDALRSFFS